MMRDVQVWAARRVVLVTALSLWFAGSALLNTGAPLVAATRENEEPRLPPETQKRVNEAIRRGAEFLRKTQTEKGFFGNPKITKDVPAHPVGFAALPGLALLESGADPKHPAVENAARFVRANARSLKWTYEIALAILFLDRLEKPEDQPLIRSLAIRLAASQGRLGGWDYTCSVLSATEEARFLTRLRKLKVERDPIFAWIVKTKTEGRKEEKAQLRLLVGGQRSDNSNTQFAILALWNARKHKLPLDYTFAQVQARFEVTQSPGGWSYSSYSMLASGGEETGSMTCVGLLALAAGHGASARKEPHLESDRVKRGLKALASYMADPSDPNKLKSLGPDGALNMCFLWSVERVGVLFDLKTIGGKDWYRWGVDLLLPAQKEDGSWVGRGSGGSPVIDTCFALLFLKRSDLLPDLRESLKSLKITDPGESSKSQSDKSENPPKGPGDKQFCNAGTISVGSSGLAISGSVTNSGTVTVSGTLNTGGASLDSSGTINFNAGGSITNDITSTGIININGASSIPGSLTTSGTMSVYAGFGVNGGGGLTNSGTMNFYGGVISTNLVTNNGTIVVQSGGTIDGRSQ